ncbi:MAG TPA: hypothetical protein VNM45_10300 [Bacillus sp. (in: firmicutes)]|nr:hypothetical protein [Bacillus sp. (in: firmicutes)]
MNNKYKEIVDTVEKFRALSRLHIEEMFFSHTKNKKNNANHVLKKLVDRGYLNQVKGFNPYVYIVKGSKIKQNGQKINQFLHIADVYLQLKLYGKVKFFEVEPRYSNVDVRPDLFVHWKGSFWFIECQNSHFSEDQMQKKINRYETLYLSNQFIALPFQREKKIMPFVWIIGQGVPYNVRSSHIRLFQSKDVKSFMELFEHPKQEKKSDIIKANEQGVFTWSL